MVKKLCNIVVVGVIVGACSDATSPAAPARLVPLIQPAGDLTTQLVPNEYIVVLRSHGASELNAAVATARDRGGEVTAQWDRALHGFAARLSPGALAELRRNPNIEFIEPDGIVTASGTQSPVGSWGQDRVDQRNLPVDNSYTYPNTASNVHVYIIDTGINATHTEFTGRVGNGANFATGTSTNDCAGHGTHVAGTIAGTTYGLAKGATVHPVRVLDCAGSGQWSWYVSGINWIIANKQAPAVANASLGGGKNSSADLATSNLVTAGVTFGVASGNSAADACNSSPSNRGVLNGVISTNASTASDARATFSNFGTCTDIYAPGKNITSAWIGSNTATNIISGTSMATPHVVGAAALYLGANPALTPAQVEAAMKADATTGKITGNPAGTPNLLVYVGNIGSGQSNQSPVANFTYSCAPSLTGFTCTFDGSTSTDDHGISLYTWTSPPKPVKTGAVVTYKFDGTGTRQMTLTVTDTNGATNAITKDFIVQ